MNSKMYHSVTYLALRSAMQYRANYFVGMVSVLFPLAIQFSLWSAIYGQKEADVVVFGYTHHQMMLYSLIATISARFLATDVHSQIANEIKSGTLNRYLVQPITYPIYRFFSFIGEKIMHYAVNLVILSVGLITLSVYYKIEVQPLYFAIYVGDMFLALAVNFLMFLNISYLSFWLTEVNRIFGVINILVTMFSGAIIPLDIFGTSLVKIIKHFPFFYTSYFLTNILSGKLNSSQIFEGVCNQLIWIIVLLGIAIFLWNKGIQRYEAVGG